MALVAGLGGDVLGALLAMGLNGELPRRVVARTAFAASLGALGVLIANGLATEEPRNVSARINVTGVGGEPRGGEVAVRFDPSAFGDGASWANVTSWQGGGLELTELTKGDDGVWRSDGAVPLSGDWKSIVRLQNGRRLAAVPVYLPRDDAIPAPEVPASPRVTREVTTDKAVLQRESKTDVPTWTWTAATGFVGLLYVLFISSLAFGVGRVGRASSSTGTADEAVAPPSRLARLRTAAL